jgi:hypothetical protein
MDSFRETNFQTESMIEKIKNIKKRKSKNTKNTKKTTGESMSNYKNIDTFEKLMPTESETPPPRFQMFSDIPKKKEGFTESFKGIPGFEKQNGDLMTGTGIADLNDPNIWEGLDNVIDDSGEAITSVDPRQIIIDGINYIYDQIEIGKQTIAKYICLQLGNYDNSDPNNISLLNDSIVLKSNVGLFLTVLFAYFILYNLLFVMFYEEENTKPVFIQLFPDNVQDIWDNSLTNFLCMRLILKIAFVFTNVTTEKMLYTYPKMIQSFIMNPFIYVFLYFFVILIVYYFSSFLKQSLIDFIMLKMTLLTVLTHFTIVFSFFMDESQVYMIPSETIKSAEKGNFVNLLLKLFGIYRNFSNPVSIIFFLIGLIIHFMFTIMICPFISAFIMLFYIIYLFFFPILSNIIHNIGYNFDGYSNEYKKRIKKMDEYFSFEIKDPTLCDPESIFGLFLRWFKIFFNFFEINIIYFTLFFIFIITSKEYYTNIENASLKTRLILINGIISSIIAFYLISKFAIKYILDSFQDKTNNAKNDQQINELLF